MASKQYETVKIEKQLLEIAVAERVSVLCQLLQAVESFRRVACVFSGPPANDPGIAADEFQNAIIGDVLKSVQLRLRVQV